MATTKSALPPLVVMLILLAVAQNRVMAAPPSSQTCSTSLATLNACTQFLAPGAPAPNSNCCGALRSVNHDCLCTTLRIASRIPGQCNLPPLNCGN